MNLLFDLLPLLLFFGAYRYFNIYVATAVAIVTAVAQVAYLLSQRRPVPVTLWVGFAVIVVFGGMTLFLHDDRFIQLKPTVLYWTGAVILTVGLLLRKNPLRALFGAQLKLPDAIWPRLTWAWVLFLLLMGGLNLWVMSHYSLETWVSFKVFGAFGLMALFVVGQGLFLSKYLEHVETAE